MTLLTKIAIVVCGCLWTYILANFFLTIPTQLTRIANILDNGFSIKVQDINDEDTPDTTN